MVEDDVGAPVPDRDPPREEPAPLRVGERGYYREFGETWQARVVADDVVQTFGPIDVLLAVTKWPGYECIERLVRHRNCHTNGHWVSQEQVEAEEEVAFHSEMAALMSRRIAARRDSDTHPQGGDTERGSVHDSAAIAQPKAAISPPEGMGEER